MMVGIRMLEIIVAIVSVFVAPVDADALRSTAPTHLASVDAARPHIAAAVVVGFATRTRWSALLAIADHESNYQLDAITPEPGGRFSCGVMTPVPLASRRACSAATAGVGAGYLAGAAHLREWLDMCRGNERCALRGYAGAWTLRCDGVDAATRPCMAARWFEARARQIEHAFARAHQVGAT